MQMGSNADDYDAKIDEILEKFANTIALGIMGNVPGAEGTPIYTKPDEAAKELQQLIAEAQQQARIDELETLLTKHSRTYQQIVTDSAGNVYVDDSHGYISKYEAQERLASLRATAQEEQEGAENERD
jgi:hypothetical protein